MPEKSLTSVSVRVSETDMIDERRTRAETSIEGSQTEDVERVGGERAERGEAGGEVDER